MNLTASSLGISFWDVEREINNLVPDSVGNAVSHLAQRWSVIIKGINAAHLIQIIPTENGGSSNAQLVQRATSRQMEIFQQGE